MAYTDTATVRGTSAASWKDGHIIGISDTILSNSAVNIRISKADTIINAKLSKRYSVPFSDTPPLIKEISTGLSCYFIMRDMFTRDGQNKNDWVDEYKMYLEMLDQIVNGEIPLVDNEGTAISQSEVDDLWSNTQDYDTITDMDDIENWKIDGDRTDDIGDTR